MTAYLRHLIIACLAAFAGPALAATPGERLQDQVLEDRARDISQHLRCVVCQNQSIDDSNAPLAKDLRVLVRERLTGGDSDRQVIDYIVARYGNFVLLKPPVQMNTMLLWAGPFMLLVVATAGLIRTLRRQSVVPTPGGAGFSKDEETRLAALLDKGK